MNWRNWNDEELRRAYDETYRKPAFSNTPRWKRASLWVICLCLPLLGMTAVFQLVARAPLIIGILVALGILGAIALVLVLKAEQRFYRERADIMHELNRRGLHEEPGVQFVAPWEDPTRP